MARGDAGQRNHGVPAPIAEPGVTGNDRLAQRLARLIAPLDHELIGGERELIDAREFKVPPTLVRTIEMPHEIALSLTFHGERGGRRHGIVRFGAQDHRAGLAGRQLELEAGRSQKIFDVIEPAGCLFAVLEIPIGGRVDLHRRSRAHQPIRPRALVRMDHDSIRDEIDAEVERAAQLPVVVAIRAQRIDRQPQRLQAADAGELHVRGVLPWRIHIRCSRRVSAISQVQIGTSPSRRKDSKWQCPWGSMVPSPNSLVASCARDPPYWTVTSSFATRAVRSTGGRSARPTAHDNVGC